jgi:hypothetical protein
MANLFHRKYIRDFPIVQRRFEKSKFAEKTALRAGPH